MKERTARGLSEGSRVTWDKDPNQQGTVIEAGPQRLAVKWDDPSQGEVSYLFYTEMDNIGLGTPTGKPRPGETYFSLGRGEVGI